MRADLLLLGVDGGGTKCRARLCAPSGRILGEGEAGPANIRFGLEESFAAIAQASDHCLAQAGLSARNLRRITACLALAGASEPAEMGAAQRRPSPFGRTVLTTDARAACIGAHGGRDGGIIIIGTGSIGWAELAGRQMRVGGWGWPLSDEGSGAWLGAEALRRSLWAHDGRTDWTPLLTAIAQRFDGDPHAIVRLSLKAAPRDVAAFAPLVVSHASRGDPVAAALMRDAAGHIDRLAGRLAALGVERIALLGGLAPHLRGCLAAETQRSIVAPEGDALDGAIRLARAAAARIAA